MDFGSDTTLLLGFGGAIWENIAYDWELVAYVVGTCVRLILSVSKEIGVWWSLVLAKWEALSLLENVLSAFSTQTEASKPRLLPWILPIWHLYGKRGLISLVIQLAVGVCSQRVRYFTQERILVVPFADPESRWTITIRVRLMIFCTVMLRHLHLGGLIWAIVEVLVQKKTL